jgi:hypothetical protein
MNKPESARAVDCGGSDGECWHQGVGLCEHHAGWRRPLTDALHKALEFVVNVDVSTDWWESQRCALADELHDVMAREALPSLPSDASAARHEEK